MNALQNLPVLFAINLQQYYNLGEMIPLKKLIKNFENFNYI